MSEEKQLSQTVMDEYHWTCSEERGRIFRRRPSSHKAVTDPVNHPQLGDCGETFHFVASCKHSRLESLLLLGNKCTGAHPTLPPALSTSDHVLFESTSLLLIKWMLLEPSSCCFSCFWYSCDAIICAFDISCPKKAPYPRAMGCNRC